MNIAINNDAQITRRNVKKEWIIQIIKYVVQLSGFYWWQLIVSSCLSFICTFVDNQPNEPASSGIRAVHCRALSCRNQRDSTERQMTLFAFILLPTFMCISRHDRRDNRARCIIVNVSQFLLLRVVLASHCRLSFHNRVWDSISLKVINLSTRLCLRISTWKIFCNTRWKLQSLQYN